MKDTDLMGYGKYSHETYPEVLSNHPGYVTRCLDARDRNHDVCGKMKRFLKYVDAKRADMEGRHSFSDEWSDIAQDEEF